MRQDGNNSIAIRPMIYKYNILEEGDIFNKTILILKAGLLLVN